jgi:hypothetical protein
MIPHFLNDKRLSSPQKEKIREIIRAFDELKLVIHETPLNSNQKDGLNKLCNIRRRLEINKILAKAGIL